MRHVQNQILKCFMSDHTFTISRYKVMHKGWLSFVLDIFEVDLRMYLKRIGESWI